jgi:hypothetical protein
MKTIGTPVAAIVCTALLWAGFNARAEGILDVGGFQAQLRSSPYP